MTKKEYENAVAYIEIIIKEMKKLQEQLANSVPPFDPPYTTIDDNK